MGYAFAGVENMLWETFLSIPFFINTKTLSPIIGALITIPVNKCVLVLLNPVTPSKEKHLSYQRRSAELIWDVTGGGALSTVDHLLELMEERYDRQKTRDDTNKSTLKGLV